MARSVRHQDETRVDHQGQRHQRRDPAGREGSVTLPAQQMRDAGEHNELSAGVGEG